MASDLNCVTLIGRLVKDCDVSSTLSGTTFARFTLAVNDFHKTTAGEIEQVCFFFPVTCCGKSAEKLKSFLVKGKQVNVCGRLKQERWEKEGKQYEKFVIFASHIQLLGGKNENLVSAKQYIENNFTKSDEKQETGTNEELDLMEGEIDPASLDFGD